MKDKKNILLFCIIAIPYLVFSSIHINNGNEDLSQSDQSAFLKHIDSFADEGMNHYMIRNRMPLYPYMMSFIKIEDDRMMVERGGLVNQCFFILLCALFFWFTRKSKSKSMLLIIIAVPTMTVFIYSSAYLKVETLFFLSSIITVWFCTKTIKRMSSTDGLCLGLLFSLCYFLKSSALMPMALWLFYKIVNEIIHKKITLKNILIIFIPFAVFLTLASPYLNYNKKNFDSYFYNVNTKHYFWMQSWSEVISFQNKYGHIQELQRKKTQDLPSLEKYLNEHTLKDIIYKLYIGFKRVFKGILILKLEPIIKHFVFWASILFYLLFYYKKKNDILRLLFKPEVLFIITYFVAGITLCSWYIPIGRGNRFVLLYFFTVFFFIIYANNCLLKDITSDNKIKKAIFMMGYSLIFYDILIILFTDNLYLYQGNSF